MCDPVSALMIAGTMLSAGGQIQQGNATAAASRYQANVAEMNATLEDRKARDALERGKIAEQDKRRDTARLLGQQQAAYAANGLDTTFGSPLDTIAGSAALGEVDALTIRSNAAREAYDYDMSGANKRADANMARAAASSAKTGSLLGAGSTLLGGAANAGKYMKTGK